MEAEKRKRSEKRESEDRLTKKKKNDEFATDAEVEEFFAILRRMQEAVKYFGEGWRTAVETEEAAVATTAVDEEDQEVKRVEPVAATAEEEEEENGHILDLNAVPEEESHVASA